VILTQGSRLSPILFKIFLNDIFYFIKNSDLYNYADDNTLSYSDHDINKVKVFNLNISRSWGKQSKAFDKSMSMTTTYLF
jgi:hypothetical protein